MHARLEYARMIFTGNRYNLELSRVRRPIQVSRKCGTPTNSELLPSPSALTYGSIGAIPDVLSW
jgi:hypothetical protein